jgi:hypothetical protein
MSPPIEERAIQLLRRCRRDNGWARDRRQVSIDTKESLNLLQPLRRLAHNFTGRTQDSLYKIERPKTDFGIGGKHRRNGCH